MQPSTNTDTLPQIRLGMLKASDHAVILNDVIIIDDNLDFEPGDRRNRAPIDKPLPTKILVALCICCIEGTIDMTLNQTEYHLEKNDCVLGMPGFIAERLKMSGQCKVIVIAAGLDFLTKSPMKGVEAARKWLIHKGVPTVVHFPEEYCQTFTNSYRSFRRIYAITHPDFYPDLIYSFTHSALTMLSSWLTYSGIKNESLSIPRKKDISLKFLNNVHEFCCKERSVTFYAELSCLSPKYFARIITETLGKKPGDIIRDNVILEAKVMLLTNTYSIQQVSDNLNFPNASFFCKYFKAATGTSPRKYQLYGEAAITSNDDNSAIEIQE